VIEKKRLSAKASTRTFNMTWPDSLDQKSDLKIFKSLYV